MQNSWATRIALRDIRARNQHLRSISLEDVAERNSEGKFLVAKFEFGGSFVMSLEGDCHEVVVTPILELLVTFGMSLEGVCHELYT